MYSYFRLFLTIYDYISLYTSLLAWAYIIVDTIFLYFHQKHQVAYVSDFPEI